MNETAEMEYGKIKWQGAAEAAVRFEAERCLLCEDPPCEKGCPAGVPVRDFIRKIRFDDISGAAELVWNANIFGASCARVCYTEIQCQAECTRAEIDHPVDIAFLQAYCTDLHPPEFPASENRQKGPVAVIGGGPAGLSAAWELARNGFEAEVFERKSFFGGALADAIPESRLPGEVISRELSHFEKAGIILHENWVPISIQSMLDDRFSAVILATGLPVPTEVKVKGSELEGVVDWAVFLASCKGIQPSGNTSSRDWKTKVSGAHVVVIGGGNSAVDAAVTAAEFGASAVTMVYRRGESEMPAFGSEVSDARSKGVEIRTHAVPVEITGRNGNVNKIRFQITAKGEPDESGRPRPVPVDGSFFDIEADIVVMAAGEKPDLEFNRTLGVPLDDGGRIAVRNIVFTGMENVFAAGDVTTDGMGTVVHSVEAGKIAARAVMSKLSQADTYDAEISDAPSIRTAGLRHDYPELETEFCGIPLINPFILAAAPSTDELSIVRRGLSAGWAGAVLKTTSVEDSVVDLKYPLMSSTGTLSGSPNGLGNIDLISGYKADEIERRIRTLKKEFPDRVIIASMMGASEEEWSTLAKRLSEAGADMIECSFSCPQGSMGERPGAMLAQDPDLVERVTAIVVKAAGKTPVSIKITPMVTDIVEIAERVKAGGAAAVTASNSIPSLMGVDINRLIPIPEVGGKSTYSGYTGSAIKPVTLRTIAEIAKNVNLPITGTGGPITWRDAVEIMSVGAHNVQFCSAVMEFGFGIIDDLAHGLSTYISAMGLSRVSEIVGAALPNLVDHETLKQKEPIVSSVNPELCIGCGRCYVTCRDGGHEAIEFGADRIPAITDSCVGCAMCTLVCPVPGAMKMIPAGKTNP